LKEIDAVSQLLPETCRAARGLLNWTQEALARAAGVCRSTIRDFEQGRHVLQRAKQDAIMNAFSDAGVELLGDNEYGVGVWLTR
jgi:transcriptional regulator with XRE-family HTH domain